MKTPIKHHYNKHKETIHNFIWRSLQIFGKQGITFLIFILCAKLLTPYDFGIYNYVLAIVFFLIIFGDFGISTATSKYVAEYNATNKKKLKAVLFNSGIIILGLTILITILTLIFGPGYLKEKYVYVLWLLPLIFLAPMTSLYDGIYRGLKQFKKLAVISLIVGLVSLSFVYILIKQYGLVGALISQNLFYLILFIALGFGYREFSFKWDKGFSRKLISYSLVIGFTSIAYYLYTKADIVILGQFGYITEIGYYELLNKFFEIVIIPFTILGMVIAPNITALYSKGSYSTVKSKLKKQSLVIITLSLIISGISFFLVPLIVKHFFSGLYTDETLKMFYILIWILPIRFIAAFISQGHTVATGNAHFSLWTLIPAGIANVILDVIFINKFGFIGVVYSTVLCYTFAILSFIFLYYLKLNRLSKNKGDLEISK